MGEVVKLLRYLKSCSLPVALGGGVRVSEAGGDEDVAAAIWRGGEHVQSECYAQRPTPARRVLQLLRRQERHAPVLPGEEEKTTKLTYVL